MNEIKFLTKLNEINSKMKFLEELEEELQTRYAIITDQYMNGDIRNPVGKEQKKILKKIDKIKKKYDKLSVKALTLKMKYDK